MSTLWQNGKWRNAQSNDVAINNNIIFLVKRQLREWNGANISMESYCVDRRKYAIKIKSATKIVRNGSRLSKQRFCSSAVSVTEIICRLYLVWQNWSDREWSGDDLSSLAQMLKRAIAVITAIQPKVGFLFFAPLIASSICSQTNGCDDVVASEAIVNNRSLFLSAKSITRKKSHNNNLKNALIHLFQFLSLCATESE